MSSLENLRVFYASGNRLTGEIPSELSNLENLTTLFLSRNQLTGQISSELGRLANLEHVFLDRNRLTGPIPSEFGRLDKLEQLLLGDNKLTGEIPPELGGLSRLWKLDLSQNELIGEVPAELSNLSSLGRIYLSGNSLTGCIPVGLRGIDDDYYSSEPKNDLNLLGLPFCDLLLSSLSISPRSLSPSFEPYRTTYTALEGPTVVTVAPVNEHNAAFRFADESDDKLSDADSTRPGFQVDLSSRIAAVRIRAASSDGLSTYTYTVLARPLPGPPSISGITRGRRTLTITWATPEERGGADITSYDLRYIPIDDDDTIPSNWTLLEDVWLAVSGGDLEYTLTDLISVNWYKIQVRAANGSEKGPWSENTGGTPVTSPCLTDGAIPGSYNPGLVTDCETLLSTRDILAGDTTLNWSADTPLSEWEGVTWSGAPHEPYELMGLILSAKDLTGTIPKELGRLVTLEVLDLSDNKLTGDIPEELGGLTNLKQLFLSGNQLTGCIPNGLRKVPVNDFVDLGLPFCSDHECFTGGAAPEASNTGLISDCEALLASRDTLAGTATLNWSTDTPITDWDGITVRGTPARVTDLRLTHIGLNGTIPVELGNLDNLRDLRLSYNELSGPIPDELGNLLNLQVLYLFSNELSGPIPAELGNLANLVEMSVSSNSLSGPIPAELSKLVSLQNLSLFYNDLSGPIPAELGSLANLQQLELVGNRLSGAIPAELGNLSKLRVLLLSSNELSGAIPAELGNLSNLRSLYLFDNQLTGAIPPELGQLSDLTYLWLHNNQLSGEIPPELGSL